MDDYRYLVWVDAVSNHNKFYEIKRLPNGDTEAKWGRVGAEGQTKVYKSYERSFEELARAKIMKGYTDVTALHVVKAGPASKDKYKAIDDKLLEKLIAEIKECSRQFMEKTYTVKGSEITPKMVQEVEADLELLRKAEAQNALGSFNAVLTNIFTDIPRKMSKVSDNLAKTAAEMPKIIEREADILDTLKQQLQAIRQDKDIKIADNGETELEHYGIDMRECSYAEEDYLLEKLRVNNWENLSNENRLIRAYRVENKDTRSAFDDYCKKGGIRHTRHLFHGTKKENVWAIIRTGLILNPNASVTGKAFGQGIYFAEQSQKSMGYTDISGSRWAHGGDSRGILLMYEVATGHEFRINDGDRMKYNVRGSFNEKSLKSIDKSYDCVYALGKTKGGTFRDSEIMVYNQKACTISHVLEIAGRDLDYRLTYEQRKAICFEGCLAYNKKAGVFEIDLTKLKEKQPQTFVFLSHHITDIGVDKIAFSAENGRTDTFTRLGSDDLKWIERQCRKCFVSSDAEWKQYRDGRAKEVRRDVI